MRERGRSVDQIDRTDEIPLKIRLITHKTHKSGPLFNVDKGEKGWTNKGKFTSFKKLALVFVSFLISYPYFTYAASFPIISLSLMSNQNTSITAGDFVTEDIEETSQNMDVLSAKVENNQITGPIGGGEIDFADEVALIPEMGSLGTTLDISQVKNNGKISVYEVREGDTLSQIAEMFDVSVNTIRWANDFDGPIRPGQVLVILPVNGITHVVKKGGTIQDIAKIYKADVREIALFNGLAVDTQLKQGDEIIVPNVELVVEQTKGSTSPVQHSPNLAVSSDYYINPVPSAIFTQGFHGWNGVDLGAPTGTPIYAAADGKVITAKESGWNGGYALMIILSHDNGTQTLYAHLSALDVSVGQKVDQGDVIGYVGSTGNSTGPHLHFEVRGAKNPLNSCRVGSVCTVN